MTRAAYRVVAPCSEDDLRIRIPWYGRADWFWASVFGFYAGGVIVGAAVITGLLTI